ncbi:MerR family transcriptional regulator [Corynebacterium testudinoris]|uniref:Putative transcriptional regulator n=1 Tax=Corynebacterium testudinoris TaxID=136857 RepID=A0A0G3H8L1_9CORY|nr:MerR family transcriptional regulator [Corynebacterium testudinoris]AKK09679.1 putative transcriptional regulator [Corynebacterium testudinoris]
MTDYHISDAADILNITTRTLRHWDHIGLLVPGWRTSADHRLYTDEDLDRALQILVYREAGLPLKEIAELIDVPGTAAEKLHRQRVVLVEKIGHLHRMVRAVDNLLEGGDTMSMEEKIELFGKEWPGYQQEAEERWGNTPEWEQAQAKQADMTREDWVAVKEEQDAFVAMLADAAARGVAPGTAEATAIVDKHRASIAQWYDMTPAKQVLLARMYTCDERFNETYQGHADYLLALVEAQAEKEGVDLASVEW